MPGNLDADALERQVLETVRELSQDVATVREHVREDVTQALAHYRQDVHRTIMAVQSRLVQVEQRMDDDRRDRDGRQKRTDMFRYLTLGAVVVLIIINLMVLAYLFGRQTAATLMAWVY